MSQETRAAALAQAVIYCKDRPAVEILPLAATFNDFIEGNDKQSEPVKAATKVEKPAKIKTEPKPEPKKVEVDYKKVVGDKVNELLKANKRSEAVELLASFNGAKSASGVIDQGEEAIQAFLVGADAILMTE